MAATDSSGANSNNDGILRSHTSILATKNNDDVPHTEAAPRQYQIRQVLDEEEYQDTLTNIVTRDYFPAVPTLQRDVALLERRRVGDVTGAVAIRRAARKLQAEEDEAARQEEEEDAVGQRRKRPRPLSRESITGFHQRVTSEDNEEFERNQSEAIQRQRKVMARLYEPSRTLEDKKEETTTNKPSSCWVETPLLMASDDYQAASTEPLRITADIDSGRNEKKKLTETETRTDTTTVGKSAADVSKNTLFFTPDATAAAAAADSKPTEKPLETALLTANAAAAETTTASATDDLLLMPPPASIDISNRGRETSMTIKDKKDTTYFPQDSSSLVEYIPKSTLPVKIQPSQTRLPYQDNSLLLLGGNGATANMLDQEEEEDKLSHYDSDISTDLDAPLPSLAAERQARARATRQQSYDFVAMTPTREEMQLQQQQSTQTHVVGKDDDEDDKNDGTGPSFAIAKERRREVVARHAEAKVMAQSKLFKRANQPRPASKTPTRQQFSSSTTPARSSFSQTPLGRALLGSSSSSSATMSTNRPSSSARARNSFGSALRNSYTPLVSSSSSKRRKSSRGETSVSRTPLRDRDAPQLSKSKRGGGGGGGATNMTDGLLRLG